MNNRLRILHLEDDPDYCAFVRESLAKDGIEAEIVMVDDRDAFEAALAHESVDIILADYSLPSYNGLQALERARELQPHTPFLLVSGTIGERAAIESLRAGATDYVLKQWPERLVPAMRRAVEEAEERVRRRHVETELIRREKYFRTLTENALDILTILNREGQFAYNSPSVKRVLGYEPQELAGQSAFAYVHPDDLHHAKEALQFTLEHPGLTTTVNFRVRHQDGSWRYLEAVGQNRLDDPDIAGVVLNSRDITDRKQAEEILRQSEEEYRLIFEGNPNPMWVFDLETLEFLEVNEAAIEHYGYTRAEFLGMTLKDIRVGDELSMPFDGQTEEDKGDIQSSFARGHVWQHRKKDGTLITVAVEWRPIAFRGHLAALTLANDVTELVKAEQGLRESEQRFRDLFEGSPDAVFVEDLEGNVLDVNPAACRLHGLPRKELIGKNVLELVPPGKRKETEREFKKLVSGELQRVEGESLVTDGHAVPVEVNASRIHYGSKPTMLLHVRDITERRQAEVALRSSEMLFYSVWENSVDGMRLTDEDGTIVAANNAYCSLVGLRRDELEGKSFTVIYADSENPAAILQQYLEQFRDRAKVRQSERKLTLHNGNTVILEDTNSVVEMRGKPPLLLSLFRDVTAERRLEEQLRQAQKMEAIGQLAGGVAHDFNNILTVIHGHASLLMDRNDLSAPAAKSAQQVIQAAERAAGLTRQLLTFSRRQVIQPRRLDMNEVVANMTKMLGRLLGEDIALQVNYWSQPPIVAADESMMEQVLLNLSVNARDAMPKGGQLVIRISVAEVDEHHLRQHPEGRAGCFVCITTTDTGCGIPPENLRRIFEPFFTTKGVGKGTGLGLATVYGIVKQHQGWIEVESEIGRGATFRVYIPYAAGFGQKSEEGSPETTVRGGDETILVVEDEQPVRELVSTLLQGYGYRVLHAESGVKALEVWDRHKQEIDLVLTDLVMPDRMNGKELAEKLWDERPDLKVIFSSGYSADVVGREFVQQHGLNYLQKPYHPQKLALTVRECLDGKNDGDRH